LLFKIKQQFLQILAGDEEEHSVLLINLLLGLGVNAWLLIGSSITSASCAHVVTQDNDNDYTIWYQGHPFNVKEPHNPVQCVSALINSENVNSKLKDNNLFYFFFKFFLLNLDLVKYSASR
jgi:hypothetical protein